MRISDWSSDVCSSDLLVDLRLAAAVGGEVQAAAVGAPRRLGIDAELVGDLGQRLAAQVHQVDFGVAAARQGQRQAAAVGRERRRTVDAAEAGDQLAAAAGNVLDYTRRFALLEANLVQLEPVRTHPQQN